MPEPTATPYKHFIPTPTPSGFVSPLPTPTMAWSDESSHVAVQSVDAGEGIYGTALSIIVVACIIVSLSTALFRNLSRSE